MAIPQLTGHDESVLRSWLPAQRWYADKGRQLTAIAVDPLTEIDLGRNRVVVMLMSCQFASGSPSTYFAPLISGANREDVGLSDFGDAFVESSFLDWLYSGFTDKRTYNVRGARTLRWVAGAASGPFEAPAPVGHLLGGEQSNTSVRFGDEAILKIFRRLRVGVNPDPEILRFLGSHSKYEHSPADLGTIELDNTATPDPIVIGAMQGFVPNSGDAWTWLLKELRSVDNAPYTRLLCQIALLGQRTAELHLALATPTRDPAFAVEHADTGYRKRFRQRIDGELRSTLDMVRERELRTEGQIHGLERQLLAVMANTDVLDGLALARVHGDFHLGQVLKTIDDFVIIDFEGEPSRPFHQRREKASPLKDVAGMLRSLDYAVASVLQATPDPESQDKLALFGSAARDAYVESFQSTMSATDSGLVPTDVGRFEAALSIFLVEKALYEVRYELGNRPDWVGIPLAALETLAGK